MIPQPEGDGFFDYIPGITIEPNTEELSSPMLSLSENTFLNYWMIPTHKVNNTKVETYNSTKKDMFSTKCT